MTGRTERLRYSSWPPSRQRPTRWNFPARPSSRGRRSSFGLERRGQSLGSRRDGAQPSTAGPVVETLLSLLRNRNRSAGRLRLRPNTLEYRQPIVTWTDRFRAGNRRAVLRATGPSSRAPFTSSARLTSFTLTQLPGRLAMHLRREPGIPYVVTEHMGRFRRQTSSSAPRAPLSWTASKKYASRA